MNSSTSIDLAIVSIAVGINIAVGIFAFFANKRSASHRLFLLQAVTLSVWGVVNFISYQIHDPYFGPVVVRLVLFFAVPNAVVFLVFMRTFPNEKLRLSKVTLLLLAVISVIVMAITMSPTFFSTTGAAISTANPLSSLSGAGFIPLIAVVGFSFIFGLYYVFKNYTHTVTTERGSFSFIFLGIVVMFGSLFILNFILPFFVEGTAQLVPLAVTFTLPFVIFAAYAIYRYRLYSIKTVVIAVVTTALSMATFLQIVFSSSVPLALFRSAIALIVLVVSILLNQFVGTISEQKKALEESNKEQESLIHFISHEVKGYLTRDQAVLASLLDGDYGAIAVGARQISERALAETRNGVASVMDILRATNEKKGTVKFDMKLFDMRAVVKEMFERFEAEAKEKGLGCTLVVPSGTDPLTVLGDQSQISTHVIRNLIDNSIKYTLKGSITIKLERGATTFPHTTDPSPAIIFSVSDTGVGISPADKEKLFTEGGKGEHSTTINPHSTGYGLFIVKRIVEAHQGRVWAESAGPNTGSIFFAAFPSGQ